MKILVVKLTSMGDVLHVMPALGDFLQTYPEAQIDWMVEENFAEIPAWHQGVHRVIPVATRRWRRFKLSTVVEFFGFTRELRSTPYDAIIDAQGLMKSAVFSRFAKLARGGVRIGYSGESIKESPAAWLYHKKIDAPRTEHAITRVRQLFADGFGYTVDQKTVDYGVASRGSEPARDYTTVMFFHGTTWASKHLPESLWLTLIELARSDGYKVELAWGNQVEYERALRLAKNAAHVTVLEKQTLSQLKERISKVAGAVSVDTGLGHMAAALKTPCVSIYGSTDASLTGALGDNQLILQSQYPCSPCLLKDCSLLGSEHSEPPCYTNDSKNGGLTAERIWDMLYQKIV